MTKMVLFDVGGVLIDSADYMAPIRERLALPDDVFRPIWNSAVSTYERGEIPEQAVWQAFYAAGGARIGSGTDPFREDFEATLRIKSDVLEYAKELGRAGYELAVLSDTIPNHAEVLRARGVYEPFGKLFLSYETGFVKPNIQAYERALDQLGLEARQVTFIDDRQKNLEPIAQLGATVVHATGSDAEIIAALDRALAEQN